MAPRGPKYTFQYTYQWGSKEGDNACFRKICILVKYQKLQKLSNTIDGRAGLLLAELCAPGTIVAYLLNELIRLASRAAVHVCAVYTLHSDVPFVAILTLMTDVLGSTQFQKA